MTENKCTIYKDYLVIKRMLEKHDLVIWELKCTDEMGGDIPNPLLVSGFENFPVFVEKAMRLFGCDVYNTPMQVINE